MFGSVQPSSSAKESQVIHTEKSAPPHNLLFNSFRTIRNESLELKIREKDTLLYQSAIKNSNLKEMPSVKESILQDDRLHSLGMAVTTVTNIDMINNAYPHQNIKVDAQTEKTVNEI